MSGCNSRKREIDERAIVVNRLGERFSYEAFEIV
jgi:hypothetical protein